MIATHDAVRSGVVRLHRVDVLIRADGGTGLPGMLASVPITWYAGRPLTLVDVWDNSHPVLAAHRQAREAAYKAVGWPEVGRLPEVLRVEQFLSRPAKGGRR